METKPERTLDNLQPHFRVQVEKLLKECPQVAVHEAFRSDDRQRELLASGASKIKRSKHQDGLAVDIHFKEAPHFPAGSDSRWYDVRRAADKLGINNGWDMWKWDANHFECAHKLSSWEAEAWNLAVVNGWTNGDSPKEKIDAVRLMAFFKKFMEFLDKRYK